MSEGAPGATHAPPAPRIGVVVAHGGMAQGMVDAVERIAGLEPGILIPVSNNGRGPDELRDAILAVVGEGPAVVFTDLGAGSCTLAARVGCREKAAVCVVTGVNLPMLLDFVFHRDLPFDELVPRLQERGRAGVQILSAPDGHAHRPASG